ncbi:MAG: NfeD family protein [Steroidobacteraceae bacterium]|jgi:membrane protein implicated in regulation of membrane protease activity
MQWWAWIAVGAILLGSELTFVNAQFYLVFVGISALVVGILALAGLATADWLQWLLFAALAVTTMLTFRKRIYESTRRTLPAVGSGPAGEIVTLPIALPPGETCRLECRGSSWSAINAGESVIAAGARARIERVDGLTLVVRGED